jgi:hypothetical protein
MFLRPLSLAAIAVAALAWNGLSAAQQYRADEFLSLDLSKAVLSPKPLGPAAGFTPGPLDVTIGSNNAAQANTELPVEPKTVAAPTVHAESTPASRTALKTAASGLRVAHAHAPRLVARTPRTLVALHGRNPVEAQARETKVQVWPCRSGGICNWK